MDGKMAMVVGVDTHKDGHSAALVDALGGLVAALDVTADRCGFRQLLSWAQCRSDTRNWVVEGTGSYGAGLMAYLTAQGEVVFEGDRPHRRAHRGTGKSDQLDAIRVAREALANAHHAQPRRRGQREAIRVLLTARAGAVEAYSKALNQVYALVVTAPEPLRDRLIKFKGNRLLAACQRLRCTGDLETATTARSLRRVARRALELAAEAADYQRQLSGLLTTCAEPLLAETGVGPITAAQLLVSWSHAGRLRNEGAFAALAGVAPIPASSGRTIRYRLNHSGDRQLNRALHLVALTRGRIDPATRQYIARRTAEGKTSREIRRCLKRYLARRFFKLLQRLDMT